MSKKTAIKRKDVTNALEEAMSLKSDQDLRTLQEYTDKITDLNKLSLGWSEEYTDVVNLEDELANVKANFIRDERNKVLLGGTAITFKLIGRTYKPMLNGIEIKGMLKHKLVRFLVEGTEPKVTSIKSTPVLKYLVQYSTYALEVYIFENGGSFFKVYLSSKSMKKKCTIKYPKKYSIECEEKIDGNMFPQMELDAIDEALNLLEELTALSKKSEAVARVLASRGIQL